MGALLSCTCHVLALLGMSPHRSHSRVILVPVRCRHCITLEPMIPPTLLPVPMVVPAHDDLVDQTIVRAFELPVAVYVGVGNTS
eukprot:4009543-Heterocapsa_arctica.AAC.1